LRSARWFVLTWLLSGCVTLPNTTGCTVAGKLAAGMICAETLTPKTSEMALGETIDFLEPQEGIAPRAGAYCMSMEDRLKEKIFMEQACRELGKRCRKEAVTSVEGIQMPLVNSTVVP
jgi:hypothetical protein